MKKCFVPLILFALMASFILIYRLDASYSECDVISDISEKITDLKITKTEKVQSGPEVEKGRSSKPNQVASMLLLTDDKNMVIIEFPGVGWKGESRKGDWGNLLSKDHVTIYVQHE